MYLLLYYIVYYYGNKLTEYYSVDMRYFVYLPQYALQKFYLDISGLSTFGTHFTIVARQIGSQT